MNLTLHIPDHLAARLQAAGGDIERKALEALALEEYRAGRLTKNELRQSLGFETRAELDGFFKAHLVDEGAASTEAERDLRDFDREKARRAVTGILEASRGVTLGGLKIKDLVDEGRP